jgi:hypothetical protein
MSKRHVENTSLESIKFHSAFVSNDSRASSPSTFLPIALKKKQ